MEHGDLVNINQCIASRLPGRKDEAVKEFGKRHEYLEILEDLRRRATDGRANLVSPPNKRGHPEVSSLQFEEVTLEARSFRTIALLVVEGNISVDTLFREFLGRYLDSAREDRMTCGDGRGGGRSGNRQQPTKDARTKRRVRKERPSEKRFRLAKEMFSRSEKDCLDAILSVNGFRREEETQNH
ncbi:hypothetical protein QYM36_014885 [Artemia franciscana]|uniref:Uncharacterized protein n=1 Tax=Artemia franciscana TaxID=6661 RepID=A0AA88HDN8_ARTSF|nr:hypothetical protein QYM36_014885 [Artemia franciscana]